MLLIYMFRLRNFIVGTMLTRVDLLTTAGLGALFFSETLSFNGIGAILVVLLGTILLSAGRISAHNHQFETTSPWDLLSGRTLYVALLCALSFSLSFLSLREAILTLTTQQDFIWRAAWTVVIAVSMQVIIVGLWLQLRHPSALREIWPQWRLSAFVGCTSALGSICWFTAFALQNASYVRAVGQIEIVFTLLISWLYFSERITRLEALGIVFTIAGVAMFRFQS